MNRRNQSGFSIVRMLAGILLSLCYAAGLVAMIMGSMGFGLMLWVISTVGGMGYLYTLRQMKKRAKERGGAEERQIH